MDPNLLRAFLTMMVCVAAIGALLWYVRRRTSRAQLGETQIEVRVLSRQALSPKSQLSIVQIGSRVLLLGITDSQVTYLGDLQHGSDARAEVLNQNSASHIPASAIADAAQRFAQTTQQTAAPQQSSNGSTHKTAAQLAQAASRFPGAGFEPAYGPQPSPTPDSVESPDVSLGAYMRSMFRSRR